MNRSPAADLARLQAQFPAWSIRPVTRGSGFTAHHRHTRERLYAPTLAALEHLLTEHVKEQ
jgi:hypothetical protein